MLDIKRKCQEKNLSQKSKDGFSYLCFFAIFYSKFIIHEAISLISESKELNEIG